MSKEAKVFLAEDDESVRKLEKRVISLHGHTIALETTSLEDALEKVKLAKEKGVNVAVLDGCLSDGPWKDDGKVIAQALRELIPSIKIVSCSSMLLDWGDVNLYKTDAVKIGEIIDKL